MMQIKILSVPVSDQAKAKAFYRDVLGFTVQAEAPMENGMNWVQMGPPAGSTSIALVTWFEKMPAGSLSGVVLETLDIDLLHERLSARGLQLSPISSAPWGRFATFKDPDGNGFVLMSPIAAAN